MREGSEEPEGRSRLEEDADTLHTIVVGYATTVICGFVIAGALLTMVKVPSAERVS